MGSGREAVRKQLGFTPGERAKQGTGCHPVLRDSIVYLVQVVMGTRQPVDVTLPVLHGRNPSTRHVCRLSGTKCLP